jgi:hypothetical protein
MMFSHDDPLLPSSINVAFVFDKEIFHLCAAHFGYRCEPRTQFKEGCKTCWCASDGRTSYCKPDACPKVSKQKRGRKSVITLFTGMYTVLTYVASMIPLRMQ